MKLAEYDAPCGRLLTGVSGGSICLCDWIRGDRTERTLLRVGRWLKPSGAPDDESLLKELKRQLDAYFSGTLREFAIPMQPMGTPFQRRVWKALMQIPYGTTVTYKDMAKAIGLPRGVRAVATAVGANPLSLIIPCHRVIGSDGSLTGYAGGLEAKDFLLRLETQSGLKFG